MADQVEAKLPPKPDDFLDSVEYVRFIGLVKESSDKLIEWSRIRKEAKLVSWQQADEFIGGKEGLSYYVEIAQIDSDGDGKITYREYNKFCEQSEKSLERSYQMLLNSGVVGTLLLSFLYPMAFSDLQPSEETLELVNEEGAQALRFIYYIVLHTTIFLSFCIVFLSMRYYVYLGYWLIDFESKLIFLAENPMVILARLDFHVMVAAVILLIPGSALVVNPYVGCIALLYVLLFLIFVIPKLAMKFELLAGKLLEEYAEKYVEKRGARAGAGAAELGLQMQDVYRPSLVEDGGRVKNPMQNAKHPQKGVWRGERASDSTRTHPLQGNDLNDVQLSTMGDGRVGTVLSRRA